MGDDIRDLFFEITRIIGGEFALLHPGVPQAVFDAWAEAFMTRHNVLQAFRDLVERHEAYAGREHT